MARSCLAHINEDKEMITLEHVLPENPEDNWPQFSPDEVGIYFRRIGNMVLHSHKVNSDLKSVGFDKKRLRYKDCPYELTAQVGRAKKWTKELIAQRQINMAADAVKAWPI